MARHTRQRKPKLPTRQAVFSDAEKWGDALNDAAWEYIESFRKHTGENMSGHHWNNAKVIIRDVILTYADRVASNLNKSGANTDTN